MSVPIRPAAYIRIDSRPGAPPAPRQREAFIEVARQRGWPEPAVYADEGSALADGDGPGLATLSAAVGAGRHDAVLMSGPGVISRNQARLMAFLFRCTDNGVAVEFVGPSAVSDFLMQPPPAARLSPALSLPAGESCPGVIRGGAMRYRLDLLRYRHVGRTVSVRADSFATCSVWCCLT